MTELTEAQWQRRVTDLAKFRQWLCWHDQDSRRNLAGLPDLILTRGARLLFVELKSETGRIRPEQQVWIDALEQVPGVEVYLWRPSDWPTVVEVLT